MEIFDRYRVSHGAHSGYQCVLDGTGTSRPWRPDASYHGVSDDIDSILEALEGGQRHTDVVLTSGGLGPTPDDLTVQALSTLGPVYPVVHEPTLEANVQPCNLRGRGELTPALLRMATGTGPEPK